MCGGQIDLFKNYLYSMCKKALLRNNYTKNVNTNVEQMWFLNLLNNPRLVDMPLKSFSLSVKLFFT